MIQFVIFLCVLVSANAFSKEVADLFMTKMDQVGEACIKETKASPDDIIELLNYKVPTTQEGKCMLFCINKAFNLQNDDGSANKDDIFKFVDRLSELHPHVHQQYRTIVEECLNNDSIKDEDPCVFAANFVRCCEEKLD
ncbi:unnamed protein product [Brassicogethes aeneus]|uniref:Uncharacterized protein n=1 Tax=Brassicogethes aeneus TaxID=1431903 RepID=A0A9P0BEV7_BRAAE|nr:unnamed protein product [Brassicogethes aeneus]